MCWYVQQRHSCMGVADAFASLIRGSASHGRQCQSHRLEILKMIDWVTVVFVVFKVLIFGACMFFAIKWHYDQGKKKGVDNRTLLRQALKLAAFFLLALLVVMLFTFTLASMLGMDLSLP